MAENPTVQDAPKPEQEAPIATPTPTPAAPADDGHKVTEYEKQLRAEAAENRKRAQAAESQLESLTRQMAEFKAAQAEAKRAEELSKLDEKERLLAEKADLAQKVAAERQRADRAQIENIAMRIANRYNFHDPSMPAKLINSAEVYDENNHISESLIEQRIKFHAESNPWMIRQERPAPAQPTSPSSPASDIIPRSAVLGPSANDADTQAREARMLMEKGNVMEGIRKLEGAWRRNDRARTGAMWKPQGG